MATGCTSSVGRERRVSYEVCLNDRELRALVIEIVLATDMSFHFQQVKNMKNLLSMPEKFAAHFAQRFSNYSQTVMRLKRKCNVGNIQVHVVYGASLQATLAKD